MSYITDKYNEGEIMVTDDHVFGWDLPNEFRPLMEDAMEELWNADLCTMRDVIATRNARETYEAAMLNEYISNRANRTAEQIAEERAEARAAFGPGETVVNVFTGERYTT